MSVTLKDEKLLESWSVVIEGAAGREGILLDHINRLLGSSELPGVRWQPVEAQPSMLKGFFGKRRNFLMVTCEGLKDYRMYVGARDYGKHLDFSWFLTIDPGFFKKRLSQALTGGVSSLALSLSLDLFDQQDLRAYVTSVHRCCVKRAVEYFVDELGQDSSKFDWRSKGFLQVW
ncbi:MAG TPA: hypothetical protein VEF04_18210 [Blastocatellia bacterium]|nr:hypothetical protein [Blastocatellia bacterium]